MGGRDRRTGENPSRGGTTAATHPCQPSTGSREGQLRAGPARALAGPSGAAAAGRHERRHRRQPGLPLGDSGALSACEQTGRSALHGAGATTPRPSMARASLAAAPRCVGWVIEGELTRLVASHVALVRLLTDTPAMRSVQPVRREFVPRLIPAASNDSCPNNTKAPQTRGFRCIGETGFEPATARPPAGCATRLRHSPWLLRTERATGIEPALEAWKASVQPQHFARQLVANPTAPGLGLAGRV